MMSDARFAEFAPPPAPAMSGDIDLGQVWSALKRRVLWILGVTLAALVGSLIAVNLVTPRFIGEAKIILERPEPFFPRPDPTGRDGEKEFDAEAVQSQIQLIMSRDVARQVITRERLVGNPEFDSVVAQMGPFSRLMVMLGFAKNPADRAPDDRVLDAYYDRLLVFAVGKSRVVAIEFTSQDRELAARVANAIGELYLQTQSAAKRETARAASDWLSGEIVTLRKRVEEAEEKVEAYRRTKGLPDIKDRTLPSKQVEELSGQLAAARTAQADAEAKAALIRDAIKSGKAMEIPDVANNELIRRLQEQRVSLRNQLALQSRTLLNEHPDIKALNAQITNLDSQVRSEAQRTVNVLENDAKIAAGRVRTISAEIENLKKFAATAGGDEVGARALEREAKTLRAQLEAYETKYGEAVSRDAEKAVPPDARFVSKAIAPTVPAYPKKVPIVLLATLAAFVLSCAIVATRELVSARSAASPVADHGELPMTPSAAIAADQRRVAARNAPAARQPGPTSRAEGSPHPPPLADLAADDAATLPAFVPLGGGASPTRDYGKLAAELPPARADGRGRRILVTEAAGDHSLLTTARGLARHLARNERVILISVADDAISPTRLGLSDLVAARASFAEIIERETGSRLHIMAPGTRDAAILKEAPDMVELALAALDQTYDWVFLMVPGARMSEFAPLLAGRTDGVILAARMSDSEGGMASDAYEGLTAAGAKHIVVAMSGSKDTHAAA